MGKGKLSLYLSTKGLEPISDKAFNVLATRETISPSRKVSLLERFKTHSW